MTLRRDLTRLALALGLTLGLLTLVAQARADDPPVPIAVGGADWGLKESFRNYIEGSIAHGTITVAGGASRNPDGSFHFPLASGTYDPNTKSTFARFGGAVHFSGHDGQLELDVSDIAVEITPSGATVFADVTSKSLSDGKAVEYPNVDLAALDVGGVEPVDDAGTTEWSTIPAQLTEAGAPAFAGFYPPGQELDPFNLSYEGPGGKPTPEVWAAPGTPGYDQLAAEANAGGSKALFVDRARGVVHVAGSTGVRALDLETLALKGSKASAVTLGANEYAFDAETGTIFAVQDATASNPIRAFTWDSGTGTYTEASLPINGTKTTHLAYEPSDDTLFAVEGITGSAPATPDTSALAPAVNTAVRDGSGWVAVAYPALSTGGRAISDVLRTGPGKFVATRHAYYVGSLTPTTIFPSEAVELTDTGSALTVTAIAGTTPPPPASGYTFGYAEPARAPDGSVVLREFQGLAPVAHMLRLTPSGGAYAAGTTTDLGASSNAVVLDDTTGTGYVLKPNLSKVEVMEDDAVVGTITRVPTGAAEFKPTYAAASDGTFYFHNNASPAKVFAYRHSGDSPTITAEPQDASVVLVGDSATAPVSFTATASADPAPTVRWQQRPLGSVVWTDVPGAEAPILALSASAASAGDRYRAVFSNSAGEIATRVATLAVKVTPETPVEETPTPPGQQPPAPQPPVALPAGVKPKLQLGVAHLVKPNGVAALARVQCPGQLICQLWAPKRAAVKIAGKRYWGQIVAPKALMAGTSTVVKVKLPPPAREALAGGKGWATLKLVVSSGEERLTRRLKIAIKGGD